ncbi:MAG TPA: hypothetical protein DC049_02790 [Spirochaetia bacterium]|nr:hypothetical protein [Spirochaetia bacterium]
MHKTRYYLDRLFCEYAILNIDSSEIIFRGGGKITCRNEILKFNSSILAEDLAVSFKTENKRLIISFIHPRSSLKADFSYEK